MHSPRDETIKFYVTRKNPTVIDKVDLKIGVSWSCTGSICPSDEEIVEHFNLHVNFANGKILINYMQYRYQLYGIIIFLLLSILLFWIELDCKVPTRCECNIGYKFTNTTDEIKGDKLTTTIDPTKELGFQIALENDGPEPAYDMQFKINSTVKIDLGKTQLDVDFEGESKDFEVCDSFTILFSIC